MYSPIVRLVLALFTIAMGVFYYSKGNIQSALMMLIALALFVSGYFFNGTVYAAFRQLKKQNFEKAKSILAKTKHPNALKKSQRAYYYFVSGFIALNEKRLNDSFNDLTTALDLGLRTENDRSIALLNLANIEIERNNSLNAKGYIERALELNCSELVLLELKKLNEKITPA